MADIRVRNLSQEAAESCYEAYLKGERPKEGTILVSGPVVVFTSDTFEMKGETLEDYWWCTEQAGHILNRKAA